MKYDQKPTTVHKFIRLTKLLPVLVIGMLLIVFGMSVAVTAAKPKPIKRIVIDYTPHDKQYLFHASDADETVYGGARGGGKSCALVMDATSYAMTFPGAQIYLFRKTFDELNRTLVRELKRKVPEKSKQNPFGLYKYNAQEHSATFDNGSVIYFRYIRNRQDADIYQGAEMDYCGIDELTQHTEEVIEVLRASVRSPKGYPARFKATCNPGGIGHIWVKKRFITGTKYGTLVYKDKESDNVIRFIQATVYDNPTLMLNDPKYVKRLENLPPSLRKAWLEGNWDIFEDQAFTEWSYEVHVCKASEVEIKKHWRKWISADNGYTDPFAWYWFAAGEDGTIYVYREYTRGYGDEKITYSDQARKVIELSKYREYKDGNTIETSEKIDFIVVGHDAFGANPSTKTSDKPKGKTLVDHYREGGIDRIAFKCAITDRKLRKAVVHEYLKPFMDENFQPPKKRAKIVILDTCTQLIDTLPMQVVDENDPEKIAETDYDHWYDSFGYGILAYHAKKSKTPEQPKSDVQKIKDKVVKRNKKRSVAF
jgi:hypothetical protein